MRQAILIEVGRLTALALFTSVVIAWAWVLT